MLYEVITVNSADIISGARKAQAEAAEHGGHLVVFRPQLTAVTSPDGEQQWVEP